MPSRSNKNLQLIKRSSVDEVIEILAHTVVDAREKRAEGDPWTQTKDWLSSTVAPPLQQAGGWLNENVANPITDTLYNRLGVPKDFGKHLSYGLLGAGIGGGLGLGSQLFAPAKKRKPLSALLAGGLAGGALGAGGSLLGSNIGSVWGGGEGEGGAAPPGPEGAKKPMALIPDEDVSVGGGHRVNPGAMARAGGKGLAVAGGLDTAGSLRSYFRNRPNMTEQEILKSLQDPTFVDAIGGPASADYLRALSGKNQLKDFIAGKEVPNPLTADRVGLRNSLDAWRTDLAKRIDAETADKSKYGLGQFETDLQRRTREMAYAIDPENAQRIEEFVPGLTEADKQRMLFESVQRHQGKLDYPMTPQELAAMHDELGRLRGMRDPIELQGRLDQLGGTNVRYNTPHTSAVPTGTLLPHEIARLKLEKLKLLNEFGIDTPIGQRIKAMPEWQIKALSDEVYGKPLSTEPLPGLGQAVDRARVGRALQNAAPIAEEGFLKRPFGGGGLPWWAGGRLSRRVAYPLYMAAPMAAQYYWTNRGPSTPAQTEALLQAARRR